MIRHKMKPFAISDLRSRSLRRVPMVLLQPFIHIIDEALLAPDHPGQCLPHNTCGIVGDPGRRNCPIECIGFLPALLKEIVEFRSERRGGRRFGQPQAHHGFCACVQMKVIIRRSLRSRQIRTNSLLPSQDDIVVDSVLDVWCRVARTKETFVVGLVFSEKQLRVAIGIERDIPRVRARSRERDAAVGFRPFPKPGLLLLRIPCPGVPEPQCRQQAQRSGLRAPVANGDADQDIAWFGLPGTQRTRQNSGHP